MVAIDFGINASPGQDSQISASRRVNCYLEKQQSGKSQVVVKCLPGLTRWDGASETYADNIARGLCAVTGKGLYAVLGNKLVRFIDATSYEEIGTIGGYDPNGAAGGYGYVRMAANMASDPQLGIVTADGLYYYLNTSTNVLTQYTGEDLPAPCSIDFLDRYLVFAIADGRIYHSEVSTADDIDPLSFAYAESRPDGLKHVVAHRGALVALGDTSLEIWEDVGTSPFAFSPIRADIDIGCIAAGTIVKMSDGLIWVDQHRRVQYMQGSEPAKISTPAIVRAIEALTDTQKQTLRACRYQFSDHEMYSLTSDNWTWEYDNASQTWHEHASRGQANWRAQVSAEFDGKFIFGEDDSGKLYYLNTTSFTEDGDAYTVVMQGPPQHMFPNGGTISALSIDAVRGVGLTSGDADAQDPQLMLDWSLNGGKTWQGGRRKSLGAAGEYMKQLTFRRLGKFGINGITFRLASSSSVFRAIMAADVQISPLILGGAQAQTQANEQRSQ